MGAKARTKWEHCWHATGLSYSYGVGFQSGGSDNVICCHCGFETSRSYRTEQRLMHGHGSYITESVRVDDPITDAPSCAAR